MFVIRNKSSWYRKMSGSSGKLRWINFPRRVENPGPARRGLIFRTDEPFKSHG